MKFNYGKIFLLGFGFFGVSVIWGVYNAFVPLFLSEKFNLAPALIGFFMTLDNIAALFIQPPVGAWSDRLRTPIGRRIPFILIGGASGRTGVWAYSSGCSSSIVCRLHQQLAAQHGILAHPRNRTDA